MRAAPTHQLRRWNTFSFVFIYSVGFEDPVFDALKVADRSTLDAIPDRLPGRDLHQTDDALAPDKFRRVYITLDVEIGRLRNVAYLEGLGVFG